MGSVRDMAHSADQVNWEARKRVEEWSTRPPEPDYIDRHTKRTSGFWGAMFALGMAVLLVATYVLWI